MMGTMRVFVTGAAGQLGRALGSTRPDDVEFVGLSSADLDITDRIALTVTAPAATLDAIRAHDYRSRGVEIGAEHTPQRRVALRLHAGGPAHHDR